MKDRLNFEVGVKCFCPFPLSIMESSSEILATSPEAGSVPPLSLLFMQKQHASLECRRREVEDSFLNLAGEAKPYSIPRVRIEFPPQRREIDLSLDSA